MPFKFSPTLLVLGVARRSHLVHLGCISRLAVQSWALLLPAWSVHSVLAGLRLDRTVPLALFMR
jgi:hypothetical protein